MALYTDGSSFTGSVAPSGGSATTIYAQASDTLIASQGVATQISIYNADPTSSIAVNIPNVANNVILIPGQAQTFENPRGITGATAISLTGNTALVNANICKRGAVS
jgi:hypothetical protein